MTQELFEWIELIVYDDIQCKKYYYIYDRICNN